MNLPASEVLWTSAPHPALRVWAGPPSRWQPNDAARRHPAYAQFNDGAWETLADAVLALGNGRCDAPHDGVVDVVQLPDGVLAWLLPVDPFAGSGLSPAEPMELAQEHGRIGLFVRDLVRDVGYWDPHAFRILGLDPRNAVPTLNAFKRLIHPDDLPAFMAVHERALAVGGRHRTRYRIGRAKGEVRHLDTLFEVRRTPDGQARLLFGTIIDDTDAVQRTQASQRSLERLARSGELAGVSVWHIDWASQTMRFNSVGRRFMGLPSTQETIALAAVRGTVHPDDVAAVDRAAQQALAGEQIVDLLARYRHANGDWRTLQTRRVAERDERGNATGLAGISIDMTEQLETERRLHRERERAAMALDAADVGTWERGLDGSPRYWSAGMYRLRGFDPGDPRPIDELSRLCMQQATRDELLALMRRHVETGLPFEQEYAITWPDGRIRWLAARGNVVRDEEGRPLHMAGVNVDVTERHHAQALRLEVQRAEESSRAKAEFLAHMSHELRTPMNAVLGFARLLQDDAQQPLSERQQERVQRIHAAGQHLLALIDKLLDLTRIPGSDAPQDPATLPAATGLVAAPVATLRALCIEDNPVNLLLVQEMFALRPAMTLDSALDGRSGLAKALADPPDLLLLDMQLPDIDGMEVMRRVRAEPRLAGCHVVALSANAMPNDVQAALDAGFDAYWTKPIDFGRFLAGLDELAARRGRS